MTSFHDAFRKLVPRWLSAEDGELVLYSLHVVKDALIQTLKHGLLASYPEFAPDDALAALGRDRKIIRGILEDRETYITRLLRWLDDHRTRGGPYALLEQNGAYWDNGFPANGPLEMAVLYRSGRLFHRDPTTKEITRSDITYNPGDDPDDFSRYWLIIHWPDGAIGSDGTWADPGTWSDGGVWDSNLDGVTVQQIQAVPRAWNALHAEGKIVLLGPDVELWDYPAGIWNDPGVWGESPPAVATLNVE